jgi:cytochrome P450
LQQIAPSIESKVDDLLADVDAKSGFDFMQSIARPLPAWVIGTLMGVEAAYQGEFLAWSEGLAAFIGAPEPSTEQTHHARESLQAMTDYFEALLPGRRQSHGDDLVSCLVQAEADGQIRAGAELLAQCATVLFAGHETTRNLLGNGLNALLAHPDQWHRLQAQPSLLQGAVRELLRFDSPVQYTGRRVSSEMMHGQRLRRGDLVIALIGAANRDPACFEAPDSLDISRGRQGALSFGSGSHVCIGAALTMMEAQAVFGRVLHLWSRLTAMQTQPVWNGNAAYRGLSSLWVAESGGGVPSH